MAESTPPWGKIVWVQIPVLQRILGKLLDLSSSLFVCKIGFMLNEIVVRSYVGVYIKRYLAQYLAHCKHSINNGEKRLSNLISQPLDFNNLKNIFHNFLFRSQSNLTNII